MLQTIFIKCKVDVFHFYFHFALRTKIFSEKVHKPINKKRPNYQFKADSLYIYTGVPSTTIPGSWVLNMF